MRFISPAGDSRMGAWGSLSRLLPAGIVQHLTRRRHYDIAPRVSCVKLDTQSQLDTPSRAVPCVTGVILWQRKTFVALTTFRCLFPTGIWSIYSRLPTNYHNFSVTLNRLRSSLMLSVECTRKLFKKLRKSTVISDPNRPPPENFWLCKTLILLRWRKIFHM